MANFCVFGGAARGPSEQFTNDAETIGCMLAARGHRMTYGGGRTGLMGAVSRRAGGWRSCTWHNSSFS